MSKSALPIVLGVGAAALLLMPSNKKKKKNSPGSKSDDEMSGSISGWEWRVREEAQSPGFGPLFFGDVRKVSVGPNAPWTPAHEKGRPKAFEARMLAWERIAKETAEAPKMFNWEPARASSELELRKNSPGVRLTVMESGVMNSNSGECHWSIMSVLPPIQEGAYAGFLICPSTGENQSRFSDSISGIKSELGIS